jgi:hypothetical protein
MLTKQVKRVRRAQRKRKKAQRPAKFKIGDLVRWRHFLDYAEYGIGFIYDCCLDKWLGVYIYSVKWARSGNHGLTAREDYLVAICSK